MEVANAHLFLSNVKMWLYLYYFLACEWIWKELTEKCPPNLILYFQKKKQNNNSSPNKQTIKKLQEVLKVKQHLGNRKPISGHLRERARVEILNCSLGSHLERASSSRELVKIDISSSLLIKGPGDERRQPWSSGVEVRKREWRAQLFVFSLGESL